MSNLPSVPQGVIDALAQLRGYARSGRLTVLAMIYPVLCELTGLALTRMLASMTVPESVLGQGAEASQGSARGDGGGRRVPDRWISARECAARLNISLRTLRRRAGRPPYSSFCIPQPERGFKVSEQGLEDFMRRARK